MKGKEAVNRLLFETTDKEPVIVILKIKEALDARGLNQKELAELTGIRPAAISQLARGYIERLNLDHLARIASALEVKDINELITLEFEHELMSQSNTLETESDAD